MPEIKNTFTQGKMNKDLDERIIPSGQYRHAENIKVSTSDDAAVGTVQNILGNEALETIVPASYKCIASVSDEKTNNLYWFVTNSSGTDAILQYNLDNEETKVVLVDKKQDTLKFSEQIITGINVIDDLLFFTDNVNEPKKINVQTCIAGTDQTGTDLDTIAHTELVVDGVNKGDINESHITVIKKNPKITLNATAVAPTSQTSKKLFEKIFPRFSYRYKYQDGEYSAFAPFTNVMFNPLYVEGYGKDDAYSTIETYNTAMLNNTESVELNDFITKDTPVDVVEIEILYKQEGTNVVYSIKKIKYDDNNWNSNYYVVNSESIYAALPENQLLRPFDVVPKKALAQEITGNRLVYGNYTQGYNLINTSGQAITSDLFSADYQLRDSNYSFENGGVPSIKSQRKYQLGFVFGDKYGRETTVFTSDDGYVEIPWFNWEKSTLGKSASQTLQLKANLNTEIPNWADYYKYYIKETSNEYYNMVMDRAYIPSKLNLFDKEEDHIWISFPSAERNKITLEDYIILKKKIGGNEDQINIENKFKVLDISNEAPEAILLEYLNIGEATQTLAGNANNPPDFLTTTLFAGVTEQRIDNQTDMVYVNRAAWINDCFAGSLTNDGDNNNMYIKNMYLSFKVGQENLQASERYKVVSILFVNNNYQVKLDRPITLADAQLANANGVANDPVNNTALHTDLVLTFERKQEKDLDEFSGKFFVKIVASAAARNNIENEGQPNLINNFVATVKKSIRWYVDTVGSSFDPSSGVINSNGYIPSFSQHVALSSINGGINTTSTLNAWRDVMDVNESFTSPNYAAEIGSQISYGRKTFFIDNSYFVAGQWSDSKSARYSGQTWGGSYLVPQLKEFVWKTENGITDFYLQNIPQETPVYAAANSSLPLFFSWNGNNGIDANRYVNGMEGYIESTDESHTADISNAGLEAFKGYRRWRSASPTSNNYTKDLTYSLQDGKKYLHLSFLGPGANLHDGDFGNLTNTSPLKGPESIGAYLQGIWGGGVFKASGVGPGKELYMEGNFEINDNGILEAQLDSPAKGVGQGYNSSYETIHENQWEPGFPASEDEQGFIRDFVSNLKKGSKFKFTHDADENVIEILSMSVKRIYNHTPWNAYKKYDGSGSLQNQGTDHEYVAIPANVVNGGDSVEEAAIDFLNTGNTPEFNTLKTRIENFGKSSNRRVTYIFEIDTDISDLLGDSNVLDSDGATGTDLHAIQFLSDDPTVLAGQIKDVPAVWETEPKEETGLDIYYEASQAYPTRLTSENNTLFAPIGSRVELFRNAQATYAGEFNITQPTFVRGWIGDNDVRFDEPVFQQSASEDGGFNKRNSTGVDIDYVGAIIMFYRPDGSYTSGRITGLSPFLQSGPSPSKIYSFYVELDHTLDTGLNWYNCFSFGNGIESDRIRDDYNAPQISNGVRASVTLEQDYKEEHRKHGLIYSGIYNSTSGVNELNQFISAQKITKDLNPTYGSIQKLFQRRISLVAFCEDKVVGITSNKDALFNADGNSQLVSTNNVLGDATPFVGDYGISKNPESFAKESYRAYFADKQRGAVLRLSMDGLTPISEAGMSDFFRDNLKTTNNIIGTYDNYSKNYNLTLASPNSSSNLISNSSLSAGSQSVAATTSQLVVNGVPTNVTPLSSPQISLPTDTLTGNHTLQSDTEIMNLIEIPQYSLLPETTTGGNTIQTGFTTFGAGPMLYQFDFTDVTQDPFNENFGSGFTVDTKYALYVCGAAAFVTGSGNVNQWVTTNQRNGDQWPTSADTQSGNWYTGLNPSFPNLNQGYSGLILWNPTRDGYSQQTPPGNESPFGITASDGNPWFNTTTGNEVGTGIMWDGEAPSSNTSALCIPGQHVPDATNNTHSSTVTAPVLGKYTATNDLTIFNGEEIRISFMGRNAYSYNNFDQQWPSGPPNNRRRFSIFFNHTAHPTPLDPNGTNFVNLAEVDVLDQSTTTLTNPDFATYHASPVINSRRVGYLNDTSSAYGLQAGGVPFVQVAFAPLFNDGEAMHEVYIKFTDGTEDEKILFENFNFSIMMECDHSGYPSDQFGSISQLEVEKVYQLQDVEAFTTTPVVGNGDGIPSVDIPDFCNVRHNIYQWKSSSGNNQDNDPNTNALNATSLYGPYFSGIILQETAQGNTISYIAPPDSFVDPSGYGVTLGPDVDNGVTVFNDGSGATNMYGTAPYSLSTPIDTGITTSLIDDSIQLDSTQLNIDLQQIATQFNNVQTVTGDRYIIDIIYTGALNFPNTIPGPNFSGVNLKTYYGIDPVTNNPITYGPFIQFTQQTVSDFYNTPTDVLRAEFTGNNDINDINILINAVDITITDIYMVNANATYTGGTAPPWLMNNPAPTSSASTPSLYADSTDGFVFTSNANSFTYLRQMFPNPPGLPASTNGYTLEFTVSNYVNGKLEVRLFGDQYGYKYANIEANGVYSIDANVDGQSGNNDVSLNNVPTGNTSGWPGPIPMPRLLEFVPKIAPPGFFEGNVSNITLVDNTNYFSAGGTIGSFTTSGFDPLLNNYIDFDAINERVVFQNAPALTGPFPGPFPFTTPVQLNQVIPVSLNTGDTYRLKFDYLTSNAGISGYYFNAAGDGFRFTIPTGSGLYNQVHTIGDDTIGPAYELVNTLVFFVAAPVSYTALDNVSFQQTFTNYGSKTISYSESVKGWTSFKSFILEHGYSLSNNYYTFKDGKLFKHNSESEPRNQFYGNQYESSITTILNDSPSVIKSFNALGYEGSQSNVIQGVVGETLDTYNEQAKNGWSVELIKTDKQEGSVKEFIEKEGKWFNYIKGKANTSNASDLSLQGIGIAIDVQN